MKIRIVLLILAIVFGIAAVFGVMIYLNNVRASAEKENELVSVLVAAKTVPKDISAEMLISEKYVEIKQVPSKYIAEGAIRSLDKFDGYITIEQISKGEQLTPLKLMKIEDVNLAFVVPDGLMAVSVPYDEIRGVSNYVKSGDKVSLIATFEPGDDNVLLTKEGLMNQILKDSQDSTTTSQDTTAEQGTNAAESTTGFGFFSLSDTAKKAEEIMGDNEYVIYPLTKILLWNVEVLSIGVNVVSAQQSSETAESSAAANTKNTGPVVFKTVTLAVTPEQAEKLIFAQELGKVWFALMPLKGINEQDTPGRTYFNISN
jgi:Flp pilus assembly protein CpaB